MCTSCAGALAPGAFLPSSGNEAFGLAARPPKSGNTGGVISPGLAENVGHTATAKDSEPVIVLPFERPSRPGPSRPEPSGPATSPPPPKPSESDDEDDPPPTAA